MPPLPRRSMLYGSAAGLAFAAVNFLRGRVGPAGSAASPDLLETLLSFIPWLLITVTPGCAASSVNRDRAAGGFAQ